MRILDLISQHDTMAFQLTEEERKRVLSALKSAELALIGQDDAPDVFQEEVISLEAAAEQEPSEWVYQWALCFSYYHIRQYDKALHSAEYAFLLQPNDPRSCYALAMVLYTLTSARQIEVEDPEREEYLRSRLRWTTQPTEERDPGSSWASLDALDLTIERAAQRALFLFVRLLHLDVTEDIESVAKRNLHSLIKAFPEFRTIEEDAHHLYSEQAPGNGVKLEELTEEETQKVDKASEHALTVETPAGDEQAFISEVIADVETAAANEPAEWSYRWVLVDYYARTRKYGKAFRAGEQALELRPNDPRSAYGLATVLSRLALAAIAEPKQMKEPLAAQEEDSETGIHVNQYDAEAARIVLDLRGMSKDQAAQLAMVLFSRTLQLGISAADRQMVENSINRLVRSFPHLGYKVPVQLCAQPMAGTYVGSSRANRDSWSFWSAYKWSLYAWLTVITVGMIESIRSQPPDELVAAIALNVILAVFLAFPVALVLWIVARVVIR